MICRKTKPPAHQHPQEMAMGEDGDIAFNRPKLCHNPVGPLRYLVDRFSVGTGVCPDAPAWHPVPNLFCSEPFVITVVPFQQFFIHCQL